MAKILEYNTSMYENLYHTIIDKNKIIDNTDINNKFITEYLDNETLEIIPKYITLHQEFNKLITNTASIMRDYGFNIDDEEFYIECHLYKINGKFEPKFGWHEDDYDYDYDYGSANYNVCTAIYYLYKDDTIIGGNLQFTEMNVKVKPNLMVLMKGDITHRIEPMDGYGMRKSIVIMFKRNS